MRYALWSVPRTRVGRDATCSLFAAHDARMAPPLLLVLLLLIAAPQAQARAPPSAIVALPAIFRGSGCKNAHDVVVRTDLDDSGGTIHVGFNTPFTAAASEDGRLTRLTCNGLVPLIVKAGKRVGITQLRLAGRVQLPAESATAQVTTEFYFPGDRGPAAQHRFLHEDGSNLFEIEQPSATIWSKCGGKLAFRVNAALTASGAGTEIAFSENDWHADGLGYELVVRDCIPDPGREL